MANVRFLAPPGINQGTYKLPDGVVVTISGGQSDVPDTSWQAATSVGWIPQPGQTPAYIAMRAPSAWSGNSLALPNGVTVTITAGLCNVPTAWGGFATGLGFMPTYGNVI